MPSAYPSRSQAGDAEKPGTCLCSISLKGFSSVVTDCSPQSRPISSPLVPSHPLTTLTAANDERRQGKRQHQQGTGLESALISRTRGAGLDLVADDAGVSGAAGRGHGASSASGHARQCVPYLSQGWHKPLIRMASHHCIEMMRPDLSVIEGGGRGLAVDRHTPRPAWVPVPTPRPAGNIEV